MKSSAPFGYAPPPPSVAKAGPARTAGPISTAAATKTMNNFLNASHFFITLSPPFVDFAFLFQEVDYGPGMSRPPVPA